MEPPRNEVVLVPEPTKWGVIAVVPEVTSIYKITIGDKYYIGSTRRSLFARLSDHYTKTDMVDSAFYKAIREGGGWKNAKCEIVEYFVGSDYKETKEKENIYINTSDPNCLNERRAVITLEERRELAKKRSGLERKARGLS